MIIAVPVHNDDIAASLEQMNALAYFEIEDFRINGLRMESFSASDRNELASRLRNAGAAVILCGHFSPAETSFFSSAAQRVVVGASGDMIEAVASFLKEEIASGAVMASACHSHDEASAPSECAQNDCHSCSDCSACSQDSNGIDGPA